MSDKQKSRGRPKGAKNKPKVLNVGQQPNNPVIQKTFSEALQAKNLGIDKVILNINGGNSELVTNKNAILKYSLKQPIQLEVGDVVTCVNAFVEEKGLAENTISFEEDIEAEMRFLYYKQGDLGDELNQLTDIGFAAFPKQFPDGFNNTDDSRKNLTENYLAPVPLYENLVGSLSYNMSFGGVGYGTSVDDLTDSKHDSLKNLQSGCNGNYYYLMETCQYKKGYSGGSIREFTAGQFKKFIRPVYGSKTIKVKAGNYSVDSLANIISAQLNGSLGAGNNEFSDALLDKMYDVDGPNKNNFFQTTPFFKNIDTTADPSESDLIGNCGEDDGYERRVDGFVKQINFSGSSYNDCWAWQNAFTGIENNFAIDPKERLGVLKFPNGADSINQTSGLTLDGNDGNTNKFPPNILTLLTINTAAGNGKDAAHIYMNKKGLDVLFETENKFYQLPGLKENSVSQNDLFYPPNIFEISYATVDPEHGFIPRTTTNALGSLPGNPYNDDVRFAACDTMSAFQYMVPVKGLNYPGGSQLEPQRQVFAGTSVAQLTFGDSVSNRFSLSNFHEFYKLPNLTADAKTSSGYGGQQATKFNNPYFNDISGSAPTDNVNVGRNTNTSAIYPVDSSSGIAVNNFDFALVKNTKVYNDLINEIQSINGDTAELSQLLHKEKLIYDLFTKPFEKFFPTTAEAEVAWSKSLWARLGFTYNQLGNISDNLESFLAPSLTLKNPTKQKGIITHNAFDFSKIVASDGLGQGNPVIESGLPMQNYRLQSYFTGLPLPNSLGCSGNYIHLLSDSKPISAQNLPSLNAGKSYLLIESDLIKPNFKDNKANWGNLLAIMSKENATNDTIFGADPIDFTITEPRLLTDITIFIKNPDGTLAADDVVGQNNGFIIQIAKPIPVQKLPSVEI